MSERMTVMEAHAAHGAYFHMWILADRCATANADDWPRRNAHMAVRDFCATAMQEVITRAATQETSE